MVAAIEDGVVAVTPAMLEAMRHEAADHAFGFGFVVGRRRNSDRIAVTVLAPELLVEELRIVRDERVRRTQDAHRRPVILLELDHLDRRKVLRQLAQVVDRRATPAIDRLVVVADDGERSALPHEQPNEPVLRGIGVLVFVDEEVAAAFPPFRRRGLVRGEEPDRQRNQVVEVDRLIGAQCVVIAAVGLARGPLVVALRGLRGRSGRLQRVLPGADPPLRGTRAGTVGRLHELGDDRLDVARVEYREAGLQAQRGGAAADDLEPERMKGADRDVGREVALAFLREQFRRPLAHLAGRLVGEGDRGDTLCVMAVRQQMRDLGRDDSRLAAAGARQHEQRAVEISHRLALRGIHRKRHRDLPGRSVEGAGRSAGGC